jgi:hypothetical protein
MSVYGVVKQADQSLGVDEEAGRARKAIITEPGE